MTESTNPFLTARYLVYVIGRPDLNRKFTGRNDATRYVRELIDAGTGGVKVKALFPSWDEGYYEDWGLQVE